MGLSLTLPKLYHLSFPTEPGTVPTTYQLFMFVEVLSPLKFCRNFVCLEFVQYFEELSKNWMEKFNLFSTKKCLNISDIQVKHHGDWTKALISFVNLLDFHCNEYIYHNELFGCLKQIFSLKHLNKYKKEWYHDKNTRSIEKCILLQLFELQFSVVCINGRL